MAIQDFDYAAARNAGYTDDQILQGLKTSGELDFDVDSALKKYSASDILQGILPRPKPPEPAPEPSGAMGRIKDIGISALKGAISVPESAIGLADIVTGGAAGRGAEAIGFRPAEAKAILNDYYSPEQKAANQRVADAKGFLPTVGAMLSNPSTIIQTGVESLPSMGAGGVIGRGALALAPKIGAALGGAIGEGVVGAGSTAEQIRQQNADGSLSLGQSGAALASGIGTGAFAAVGGRIAQKLGIADIDTALVQAGAPAASTKGIVRRMLEGGVSEGVFEELPQSIQEQMWQNAAMDKPLLDGVPENAAQGLLAGGLFGGVAGGALHGKPNAPTTPEQPAAAPLLLGNTPDPFLSFPDGSVGRRSDAEAFINNLPEAQREAARARMFGGNDLTPQPMTADDVLQAQSLDDAIAIANQAIEQGTPEFQAQRNAGIDAAWLQHLTEQATQRQAEFQAAEEQRRAAETAPLLDQVADQNVAQANAMTEAQDFGLAIPNQMQTAMQEARNQQAARIAEQSASQLEAETGAAYGARDAELSAERQAQFDAAEAARKNSDAIAATIQAKQQDTALANSISADIGTPSAQPTAMQLAMQEAAARRSKPVTTTPPSSDPVAQAKAVLTAAGVTGNERMAALRSIRTGENTIEDLIDAHPPKAQEANNGQPLDSNDRGITGNVGGRGDSDVARAGANQFAGSGSDGSLPANGRANAAVDGSQAAPDILRADEPGVAAPALERVSGRQIDKEWTEFARDSGTLGIGRDQMPQVQAAHRGALVNYLGARGITHETTETPAVDLKPTQREFSNDKVQRARDYEGGDRSILVSSDNHILDGHHQWLAKLDANEPVKVIRLDAPIRELLAEVHDFPSSQVADGAQEAATPAAPQTKMQSEVDRLRTARDARIEAQRNKPKSEAQQAVDAKYARQEAEIARAKENEAERKAAKEPAPTAAPDKPSGAVTERYLGRYGKGMSENNAKVEAAERNKNGNGTTWRVEANEELGYDRYEVVGYKDAKPRKSEPKSSGGMTADDNESTLIYDTTALDNLKAMAHNRIAENVANPSDVRDRLKPNGGTRWEYPAAMGNSKGALTTNKGQKSVVDYMNGDITKDDLIKRLGALDLYEGNIRSITNRTDDFTYGDVKKVVELQQKRGFNLDEEGAPKTKPRKSEAPASGGMTATAVNKAIVTLKAKWLGFTKVNTVQSVEDLPADIRERADADAGTEGIYDPQTKAVYLIADNIASPERAAWVAAHEVSHAGLRMLHDKSVNEALNIAAGNKYIKELAAAIQEDRGNVSDSVATEEALAELSAATESDDFAALGDRYGVKVPAASRNGVIGAVARVYEAVKRFLASITGKPMAEVSNADVRALIGEQRAVVEGRETNTPKSETKQAKSETEMQPALQSRAPAAPPEEVMPKWAEGLTDVQKAALRKSGAIYTEETFKQKVAKLKEGALKKLQYGILDQFAPIKDQLGKIPYVMARMAKNADGTLEALMLYGRPHLDADGGMLVDTTKKGFIETMQTLNGEHDRFFSWMAGRRAEQLKKEGRENLFTNEDISALSTLNQGQMKDGTSREAAYLRAQKDVAELNKSVLDIAEKSGLIDGESRKVWASDFYVPFYRIVEEGVTGPSIKSGLVNQKSIKKLKGGTNNLGDLTQNMLMNWSTLLTASAKNRAAKASLDAATQIGAATEADEATIRAMGKSANTKAVSYMENGVNRWHVVEDEHLLAAISALEFNGYNNQAMKAMSWFKNTLTKLVTVSPYFKVRNLIRDSLSVLAVSDINRNPFLNIKNGYSLMRDNDARAQMVAGGGIYRFGMTMEGNRAENIKRLIDSGIPDDTILNTAEKMTAFTKKLWHAYEEIGDLSENVNRAALYQKLRNEGATHLEASFEARDLMDFGLSGAWAGVRALNQILPFFQARMNGLRKLGIGYNDDPKRMMYVVGALALATIALSAAYKDDDDFKKRSDSDRNNYWWFKVGGIAYRIPRPFEIGAAASAIDNFSALFYDSKNTSVDRFTTQMSELINAQLAMNPIPQVFRPLIDVYSNKDAFTGRPIESMAMQRLRPEDRYTNNTSELARLLSKSGAFVDPVSLVAGTGVRQLSPLQIDSLIKGYFAGAGALAVAGADGLLHHTLIDRGAALPVPLKTLTGSFAEDLPSNSSRYVDMLYKTAQDVEQTYASYQNALKQGDIEKARSIMKEDGATIAKYHMIESLKKNESRIGQVIQRTMNDKTLTGEQKAETIRRLKAAQDKIARLFATKA